MTSRTNLIRIILPLVLPFVGLAPIFAQGTFTVGASASTVVDIGVIELTGQLTLTVLSGLTVESPISIQYSAPITNNNPSQIMVSGTGGLVGIGPFGTLDTANNAVRITVPAGGIAGNLIRIIGVRVDATGLKPGDSVTATVTGLTAGGNAVAAGQNRAIVIDRIIQPFAVEFPFAPPITIVNGIPTNPGTSFVIREASVGVFSDSLGYYGQTIPSRLRIRPFPSVPKGVHLTFNPVAASTETTAAFRTVSGVAETVPRTDGSTDVLYEFDSALESPVTLEGFRVYVTVTVDTPADSGTISFQTSLEPIGIAVPNLTYPSTEIPRYLERLVPPEEDLIIGAFDLQYPFRAASEATYTGIAITNPLNYRVRATITAYDNNGLLIVGQGITNPVSIVLPRKGQYAKLATEIFGAVFNVATLGSVRVLGSTPLLAGFYLQGRQNGSGLDGATADVSAKVKFALPAVFHQMPNASTILELFNPGSGFANAALTLFDATGRNLATVNQSIAPGGTVIQDLRILFPGINPDAFAGGYIMGEGNVPLVARETFGNALDFNVLSGQTVIQRKSFQIAHFATGGGYQTELSLVNLDPNISASITLTAIGNNGNPFSVPGNPAKLVITPKSQVVRTVAELLPSLGPDLRTGYIKVDVEPISSGYFTTTPPLIGFIRFSAASGYGSSALPLEIAPMSEFVYSHVAQSLGYFTGIAILNSNTALNPTTVEVVKEGGELTGTYGTILQPGEKISKLLHEMVPASLGQLKGYIRITSTLPVISFSLFGTDDGLSLSAIPPQNVGK